MSRPQDRPLHAPLPECITAVVLAAVRLGVKVATTGWPLCVTVDV